VTQVSKIKFVFTTSSKCTKTVNPFSSWALIRTPFPLEVGELTTHPQTL